MRLQERGVMDRLHTKWWKAKRGGGACQVIFISIFKFFFIKKSTLFILKVFYHSFAIVELNRHTFARFEIQILNGQKNFNFRKKNLRKLKV